MALRRSKFRASGSGHGDSGHGGLLITPLLDLFVALIPFLIMSVVLTRLNTVDISLQKPGASNETTTPQQEQELTILLRVFGNQAELSINNKSVGTIARKATDKEWFQAAHAKLVEIKKANPKEMRIFIEAGERVSIETLMGFMDSARELRADDAEIFRKEDGKDVKLRYLFPKVILKGVYS